MCRGNKEVDFEIKVIALRTSLSIFWNIIHSDDFYVNSLSETYELKRQQHLADLQRKEDEMRQTFVIRVKEKEAQLKETEKEVSEGKKNREVSQLGMRLYWFLGKLNILNSFWFIHLLRQEDKKGF